MNKKVIVYVFLILLLLFPSLLLYGVSVKDFYNAIKQKKIDDKNFETATSLVNIEKTDEESRERYWTLKNSCCLSNAYYNNCHFLIDSENTLLPQWAVIENNVIFDFKEDPETLKYNFEKVYGVFNYPIKEGAIINKSIYSINLTNDVCQLDYMSITNNEKLKYVTIDSEVNYIDEDAFRDNPNILCYHICCGYYYEDARHYDLSYYTDMVKGEVGVGDKRLSVIWKCKDYVKYIDINGILFTKDNKKLMFYPIGRNDKIYNIPYGVAYIGNSAFYNAKHLKEVSVPQSVKEIGNDTFFGTELTLSVYKDSYAETYAKEHNIKYKIIK